MYYYFARGELFCQSPDPIEQVYFDWAGVDLVVEDERTAAPHEFIRLSADGSSVEFTSEPPEKIETQ